MSRYKSFIRFYMSNSDDKILGL